MSYSEQEYYFDESRAAYLDDENSDGYKNHHEDKKKKCKGCVCDLLKNLHSGTKVDIFLKSSQEIKGLIFIRFNDKNCCASFVEQYAEHDGSIIVFDCEVIKGIKIKRDCSC
ncbi:hydrolase [Falsibacillus pallidus]|uniref:hydrolase n=1 Tax=Falsibacillus pallidus TaxID=493781 RepID=UPI003D978579